MRLAWCWDNRDTAGLQDLFTDDYEFAFSVGDTSTAHMSSLHRDDELRVSRHLFLEGSGFESVATSIEFAIDPTLTDTPDSRPGRDPLRHREVLTAVLVHVRSQSQEFLVAGHARFFLVRGDSAGIPQALINGGTTPDSSRWWIERWEDETDAGVSGSLSTSSAQPSKNFTLGLLKTLYLPDPLAPH